MRYVREAITSRPMHAHYSTLIAGVIVLLVTSGFAGATAPAPPQQNETDLDTHPEDGHYEVIVRPEGPGDVSISIRYYYEPRSPRERRLAQNSSLDADWFRGDDILQGAIQYQGRSSEDFEFRSEVVGVSYSEYDDRITISRDATWPGFMQDRDREVIGPGFASRLEDGDAVEVQLDFYDWEDWSANYEETGGEAGVTYSWTVGTEPEPRLVLNRSDYKSHDSEGLGPVPFLLPAVALALVALAARVRE